MASRRLLAAVILLSIAAPSSQFTHYEEDSCNLVGDPDLYGIGVRLSYYLANFAGVLGLAFANRQAVEDAKRGNAVIGFALFIVLVRNATLGALSVFEWDLVFTMVFLLMSVAFIPLSFMGGHMSTAALAVVYGLYSVLLPWVYFKLGDQGRKEECGLRAFFFAYFDFYNTHWIGFLKAMSIFTAIAGVCFILGGFVLAAWAILHPEDDDSERSDDDDDMKAVARGFAALSIIVSIVTIVSTEKRIQGNNVDLSEAGLSSTSQLIPFLVGFCTFLSTLWSCIKGSMAKTG